MAVELEFKRTGQTGLALILVDDSSLPSTSQVEAWLKT